MLPSKLAFVDIETTGMHSLYDRVIEIGILRVEDNKITKTFHSLIDPQARIAPEITQLTGITPQDLENSPTFRQIKDEILDALSDCIFVAHNVRFDYGFLKHELKRENISFSSKHFCTVRLSRLLYPALTHHNLDAIIQFFNLPCENRHRALDDAKVLFHFYQQAQADFPPEHIEKIVEKALKKPSLPMKLAHAEIDKLPECPGVYIFYGKSNTNGKKLEISPNPSLIKRGNGQDSSANSPFIKGGKGDFRGEGESFVPLYIGKSKNIKERVLSHFASDIHSSTEMKISQQIENIETIPTPGELGALFLESELVKKLLPLYNKKSRIKRELIALKSKLNDQGYQECFLEPITTIDPTELDSFLGFFRSRKQAKLFLADIGKKYSLCEKLLGLESTNPSGSNRGCFANRLGRCKGACIGAEKPIIHNLKFVTAFSSTKIKPWPFPGPIIIEENDGQKKECFVINKWCYLENIKIDSEENKNNTLSQKPTFDLDIYKIIKQYLSQPQNYKKVRLLKSEQILSTEISSASFNQIGTNLLTKLQLNNKETLSQV